MARKIEDVIRDTLGNQLLEIARLMAEVEALSEQLAAAKVPAPNRDNGRSPDDAAL